jgi:hypothetical protein
VYLSADLACEHQQHKYEGLSGHHDVMLLRVQARARAGSEASELRAALDAISKEKAAISEQLAVLKTHLCFVLQVSQFSASPCQHCMDWMLQACCIMLSVLCNTCYCWNVHMSPCMLV